MKKNTFLYVILMLTIFLGIFVGIKLYSYINTQVEVETSIEEEIENDYLNDKTNEVEEDKITSATILATGDIMFHSPQIKAAYDSNKKLYDFKNCFKYVKKYINSVDLALGNFETVTAGEEYGFHGYPNFNSPQETVQALKDTGYDIISTANNHCLDQKKQGLISTIDTIKRYGMKNIGTYKERTNRFIIEKINDINIALLSYTYGCNGMEYTLTDEELDYMVNIIDEQKIKNDIKEVKNEGVDIIVVYIHWGNEYQRIPSDEQLNLSKKMVEWGANIIFGSHPHVVQCSEVMNFNNKDNFIIYSMGNFLSNQRQSNISNKYTEDGVMVSIEIEKNISKKETIIKNIEYIPTWVRKYKEDGKLKYCILPIKDFLNDQLKYNKLNGETKSRIEESFNDTMSKLKKFRK